MKKLIENIVTQRFVIVLFFASLFPGTAISNFSLVFLVLFGLLRIIFTRKFIFSKETIPFYLYFLLACLSMLWSYNIDSSIRGFLKAIPFFVLPFFVTQCIEIDKNEQQKIIRWFSFTSILFFVFCIITVIPKYIKTNDYQQFTYHNLVYYFENNSIYISLIILFNLIAELIFFRKKLLNLIILSLLFGFLVLLSSKMALIILLICILLIIFRFFKFSLPKKLAISSTILVVIPALLYAFKPIRNRFSDVLRIREEIFDKDFDAYSYIWDGLSLRIFQWRIFNEMLTEESFFWKGYGINASVVRMKEYYEYYNFYPEFFTYNFHNQYIQTFSELGIFGLLLLCSFLIIGFYVSYHKKSALYFLSILIFAVFFITESFLSRQKGVLFFVFIYFLMLKFSSENKSKNLL